MERRIYRPREKFVRTAMAGTLLISAAACTSGGEQEPSQAPPSIPICTETPSFMSGPSFREPEISIYLGAQGKEKQQKQWELLRKKLSPFILQHSPSVDIDYWKSWDGSREEPQKEAEQKANAFETQAAEQLAIPRFPESDQRKDVSLSRNGQRIIWMKFRYKKSCTDV